MRHALLDQTCPHCDITEAKGAYCTKCFRSTQPGWIHLPRRSVAQRATAARLAARVRKGLTEAEV